MLKKSLQSLACGAILLSGPALAADLPELPQTTYAPVPVFAWSGFYVGLNAGVRFNVPTPTFIPRNFPEIVTVYAPEPEDVTFTGGAQVGANWQMGALVVGLEADVSYLNREKGRGVAPAGAGLPYGLATADRGGEWFATIRPRLGVAFDRTLLYVTGGLAISERQDDTIEFFNSGPPRVLNCLVSCTFRSDGSGVEIGWALGGGVEYALANNLSLKIEYLHVDLGQDNRTYRVNATAAQVFESRGRDDFDVVRAGINFRF